MKPVWLLGLLPLVAAAQETQPHGEGPHAVLVTEVVVVQVVKGVDIAAHDQETKVEVIRFPSFDACEFARNTALTPTSISIPLGTGNLAQAHIGRTTTACFQQ